ncbi:DUF6-domain-containing protein [Xylariaceae sp. FL0016]|nr:DUF6-domain-containing protein [Xylariaceae sp. FL0016]
MRCLTLIQQRHIPTRTTRLDEMAGVLQNNPTPSMHSARKPASSISEPNRDLNEPGLVDHDQQFSTALNRLRGFYERNFGLLLVFTAQTFGSIMNTAAKLLTSTDGTHAFHALHIVFVRMLATSILGMLYMWLKEVPHFPMGQPGIRGLLVFRGMAGFVGLVGLYYSLSYLEISDATAMTFLVPTWTAIVCYLWLGEPYRLQEALASLVALIGVLCIARPAFFSSISNSQPSQGGTIHVNGTVTSSNLGYTQSMEVSRPHPPATRAIAMVGAVIGTLAAAIAYATIRVIGKRAHSLVSVNYFAVIATVGSALIILIHPDLHFAFPRGALEWTLLVIIGVAGFLLQFLLTEGLQREKGGRATNMIYIQMVFALIIERVIWGTTPPFLSMFGSVMIIGASLWLSMQKSNTKEVQQNTMLPDEESSLLGPGRREGE